MSTETEIIDALNRKEAQFNRDDPHPELKNFVFRWKNCEIVKPPRMHKGYYGDSADKHFGRFIGAKYRLTYTDENWYVPRPWYNKTKTKDATMPDGSVRKGTSRITSVTIPISKVQITPPSIYKLAGSRVTDIKPLKQDYDSRTYRVTYYGGKYRISDKSLNNAKHTVKESKFVNIGDSKTARNKLKDALAGRTNAVLTDMMPDRRKSYPIDSMYPNRKEYIEFVTDVITNKFMDEMLADGFAKSIPQRRSKANRDSSKDAFKRLVGEDSRLTYSGFIGDDDDY